MDKKEMTIGIILPKNFDESIIFHREIVEKIFNKNKVTHVYSLLEFNNELLNNYLSKNNIKITYLSDNEFIKDNVTDVYLYAYDNNKDVIDMLYYYIANKIKCSLSYIDAIKKYDF